MKKIKQQFNIIADHIKSCVELKDLSNCYQMVRNYNKQFESKRLRKTILLTENIHKLHDLIRKQREFIKSLDKSILEEGVMSLREKIIAN